MRFSAITAGVLSIAGLVAAAPALEQRATTAQQVIDNTNKLTTMSEQLDKKVSAIPAGKVPAKVDGPLTPLAVDFADFVTVISGDLQKSQDIQPFDEAPAKRVCAAYENFATVHSDLLTKLTARSSDTELFFAKPLELALRQSEKAVDTYSFAIIDNVPTCAEAAKKNADVLSKAYTKAICAYTADAASDPFCSM